ncbi:MAG: GTP 3',8-cyclase MoaA [Armatimonadetes bacterium]|nr:GTP 3',8-cyclase MoaA [Armatimonadota bacterium]
MPLIDSYNRRIDYLRVSVTDRCNFRCVYCMPEEGAPVAPRDEILTYEELERLIRIAIELGMTKIRLTGGEPLIRKDILTLVQKIGAIPGLQDLSITTNGYLLSRYAADFAKAGMNRVNVSLDTLHPDRFIRIARRGNLDEVLSGIYAAQEAGLTPVKINCVAMRGWNDDEVVEFAKWTLEQPFDVRFIELMPINWSKGDDSMNSYYALSAPQGYQPNQKIQLYADTDAKSFHSAFRMKDTNLQAGQLDARELRRAFISAQEIRERIEAVLGTMEPAEVVTNGPAQSFRLPGALGTVGFISQITNDMCVNCNRLRLTADGYLRPCLMADGEVDLRSLLRSGASDDEIAERFRVTVYHKPKEHRLEDGQAPVGRNMSQLGG